ncbi:MAG: hypothetical protein LUG93_03625 [Lachnospiraceae bacterium]|nr:hypothetical protein [Lachnospiraceae bacterium]
MKKMFKKLSVIALAFTMLFTAIPASAATSTEYYYLPSKTLSGSEYYDMLVTLDSTNKITASSVKSSSTSVATRYSLYYSGIKYSNTSYESSSTSSDSYGFATISFKIKKTGSTTISYKIGSTTYKTKLYVKAYTNPVSSITLTNVNSSKTFATKTKSSASASATLKKTTANAKLKISAKSGWKVQIIQLYYSNYTSSTSTSTSYYRYYNTPKSSVSVAVGRLTKGRTYTLAVTYVNTSNGGTITTNYTIS